MLQLCVSQHVKRVPSWAREGKIDDGRNTEFYLLKTFLEILKIRN